MTARQRLHLIQEVADATYAATEPVVVLLRWRIPLGHANWRFIAIEEAP